MLLNLKGGSSTKTSRIQELLLATLPQWHYRVAKPFKQLLEDGISPEMYYCLLMLRVNGDEISMTEFARITKMPKQQMTKMVNKLIECEFVERLPDPDDRRIIKLRITEKALLYIEKFSKQNEIYYNNMLESMEESDRNAFGEALETLHRVFDKMPCEGTDFPKKGN